MTPEQIYSEAVDAALKAAANVNPVPMGVVEVNPLTREPIPGGHRSIVNEGLCGFGWVNIKPARGKFVKYLKDIKAGRSGYYGGFDVGMSQFSRSQSYERAMAAAKAFSEVLNRNGIKAYADGRLD
jgi:hypothetical protein